MFGEEFLVKLSAVEMWRGLFCPVLSLLNVAEPYLNAGIVSMWVKCRGSAMCSQIGFFLLLSGLLCFDAHTSCFCFMPQPPLPIDFNTVLEPFCSVYILFSVSALVTSDVSIHHFVSIYSDVIVNKDTFREFSLSVGLLKIGNYFQ